MEKINNAILKFANNGSLVNATKELFNALNIPYQVISSTDYNPSEFFDKTDKFNDKITTINTVALIDEKALNNQFEKLDSKSLRESDKYDALGVFAVELVETNPTRSTLAEITRAINIEMKAFPVVAIFRYGDTIAISSTERTKFKSNNKSGEKIGKVSMLKDINVNKPHTAHIKILKGLQIDKSKINSFEKLYVYWQKQLSIQALNDQFYEDLQSWFYYATQKIKLPFKPDYLDEKENTKNFIVRLLARTLFCWFVKEKGLIKNELLELKDWDGKIYPLTNDYETENFLYSNSYYRGILQNIFYNALNQKEKKNIKNFKWTEYWHHDLRLDWLTNIPYLNGGIFDKLEEDNAKESIEDEVIKIPNFLFYGIEEEVEVTKGKGIKAKKSIQKVEHKGLNGILKSFKFTLDENTPFEEDIALDPEMLGLVFENLLAELDPNLEESTIKSIRRQTGSYYTPRKVIFEMVNDCLNLYISKFIEDKYPTIENYKSKVNDLVYFDYVESNDPTFENAVIEALDKYKVLDPACGSGAFPMGMLHRIVDLLKTVDKTNEKWLALKLKSVDKAQQVEFKNILNSHLDDYSRKLGIIRDSIYGIDIQPLAVQITKLRFFISLLIDQKTDKGITPMPNIETKIICANSLKNIQADLFSTDAIERLVDARSRYYQPDITKQERETISNEIIEVLDGAFPTFAKQITGKTIVGQNKVLLRDWFTHGTLAAPFFNMDFFYPELKATGGFDCVIGNPPYGGVKISDDVRTALDIESKDPYGAFIARFLNAHNQTTPLKHGGVLAYIVSDTFMTIKSHLKLRKHLMQNYVHKMLRVHPDTFRATVNTVIMIAERNTARELNDNHICLMADLTNISIHDSYEHFVAVLNQTKGVNFESAKANISNEEYAIYYYPQTLIKTNSNLPFFVASPKLFALMNDSGKELKKELKEIVGKQVQVRKIQMNGKQVEVVKLGDIAEIRQGLITGANELYLFQTAESRGTYRLIEDIYDKILLEEEVEIIVQNENLRTKIINKGISKSNDKSDRFFGGRYIVPHDKGGESDAEDGWMPNYSTPSDYFIDWSEESVNMLKKLTTFERNELLGKNGGNNKICSRFQNIEYYFKKGLTLSHTGVYSPTFRLNNSTPFNCAGSCLFSDFDLYYLLAILNSKFKYYSFKSFINHTVNASEEPIKDLQIPMNDILSSLLLNIQNVIQTQKSNPRYDYASHEQIEIDKLVYEAYGLNAEDVQEVENWYARRYPKLSAAQKANLRALGKSDDYLELYGLK